MKDLLHKINILRTLLKKREKYEIICDFSLFKEKIVEEFDKYVGNESNFSNKEFQRTLVLMLADKFPDIFNLALEIKMSLSRNLKFALVKGLNFSQLPPHIRDLFILAINSCLGYATPTDQVNKKVLWPIKAEANPIQKDLTFSQRTGEAEYHTDSQYLKDPEQFFSLWCVNPDKNGEGINGLLSAAYIIKEISKRTDGKELIKILSETQFPFKVPPVFTATGFDKKVEYVLAPILAVKPRIRYRKETITKAMFAAGITLLPEQIHALDIIETIINNAYPEYAVALKKDEVLFVNNYEYLHSRSHYSDVDRFLIRVRVQE